MAKTAFHNLLESRRRKSVVTAALPKSAEGAWGSYHGYPRRYFVGGNWKCNGDVEFAEKFTREVLKD
jgi:hypothetical protein